MKKVKNNIYWVGKNDWELRKFHGYEYSTHKGSSYNSFLIREEKTVLIDTVWAPFTKEFIDNLAKEIDLKSIDYVVMNHAEPDHSGAIPELMKLIPDTPIYCTENGVKSLKGQFHGEWNFKTVKTGDKLDLGNGKELIFIEARMLHWPDSMFCYLTGDNVLFSNDAFGQHFCSELLFNDLVDQGELYQEAIKYYANILTPFSALVNKKIDEVLAFNLPVDMICPSHGIIWRENPLQIVTKYQEWASDYQENQVTFIYETMYNGTRAIAEAIAKGLHDGDNSIDIRLYNIATNDKNDIITEIFKSKAVFFGSPTMNNGIMSNTAGMLELVKGLKFKGKRGGAYGCYGWRDQATAKIAALMEESGFEVVGEAFAAEWYPTSDVLERAYQFGLTLPQLLK